MRYTKQGWTHDTKNTLPYMLMRPAKGGRECTYSLAMASPENVSTCCLPRSTSYIGKGQPMTLAECLMLLANISLGQRSTTPQGQSKFIGRYNKTFFKPSSPVRYGFTQDTVSKTSSLANYVHARRWNRAFGVLESLYEEYLFVCGNIAYSLYDAAYRYKADADASEMRCAAPTRKHGLYVQDMDEKTCQEVSEYVNTPAKAAEIVEGAMISGFVQDRSAIAKDRANLQLQTTLSKYRESGSFDIETKMSEGTLICMELIDYFSRLARAGSAEFWIVREEDDEVTAFVAYDKARWEENGGTRGFVRIPTRPNKKAASSSVKNKKHDKKPSSKSGAKVSSKNTPRKTPAKKCIDKSSEGAGA